VGSGETFEQRGRGEGVRIIQVELIGRENVQKVEQWKEGENRRDPYELQRAGNGKNSP